MALNTPVGIEAYDVAMNGLFSSVPDYEGEIIPIVFARPDRAFATADIAFPSLSVQDTDNLPLPLLSLWRQDPVPAPERDNTVDRLRIKIEGEDHCYMTQADKSKCLQTNNFLPYNIPYQLELWCRDILTENAFTDYIRFKFLRGGIEYINIDFSGPFSIKRIPVFERSVANNTDIEGGEEIGYRRITYDFEVWAYMLPQGWEQGTVWNLQVEHLVGNTEETAEPVMQHIPYEDENGDYLIPNTMHDIGGGQEQSAAIQEGVGTVS